MCVTLGIAQQFVPIAAQDELVLGVPDNELVVWVRGKVVAVNVDTGDDTKPQKFLGETGVKNLARYRENTLGLFNGLKQQGLALGLPVTLLIDKDGCLLASMNGPAAWASDDAKALIEAASAD